jgi:hypothetical protein
MEDGKAYMYNTKPLRGYDDEGVEDVLFGLAVSFIGWSGTHILAVPLRLPWTPGQYKK